MTVEIEDQLHHYKHVQDGVVVVSANVVNSHVLLENADIKEKMKRQSKKK